MKITRVLTLLAVCTLLMTGLLCSCGSTTYQLTIVIEGQGNVSPASGTFASGSTVTLTASPASSWEFNSWGGQANGSQNPISITMDSDKEVYVYFTAIPTSTPASTPASTCFSFVGNPSGWSVVAGYTDPPTITYNSDNGKYVISSCTFSFGGNDYYIGSSYDGEMFPYSYLWSESEVTSIGCALYSTSLNGTPAYAGIWILHGQKDAFEQWVTSQGLSLTCDAYVEGMFGPCSTP